MTPTLWAVCGGVSAITLEWAYRRWPERAWVDFWPLLPLALVINYSVWRIMQDAPTLLEGFIVFGVTTALLRVAVSTCLLGEGLTWQTLVAVGFLLAAKLVQTLR